MQPSLLDSPQLPAPVLALRPYQTEAIDAVLRARERGVNRPLIVLPTGGGKTVIFCHLARILDCRTLIVAHRDELIQQAAAKMRHIDPRADIGIVKAESDQHARHVVVASVQTLQQPRRLVRFAANHFGLVIVDEAHHATAKGYRAILRHLGAFAPGGPLVVGVTATPDRADGVGLKAVFDQIVFERDLLWMIGQKYLVPPRGILVRLADLDLRGVKVSRGDYQDGALGAALEASHAPALVAAAYQRHAAGRTAICYWPTVATAEAGAAAMRAVGLRAEAIDGTTDQEVRRQRLHDLATGAIQVLHNCAVLTEGTDIPTVSCIIIARPTKSRALYTQIVGRGLRLAEGKQDCVVLDVVGATKSNSLITVNTLLGKGIGNGKPKSAPSEATALREEPQQIAIGIPVDPTQAHGEAVALFGRSRLRWVQAKRAFVLPVGAGWLMVESYGHPTQWRLIQREDRTTEPSIVVDRLTLEECRQIGDDVARGLGYFAESEFARRRPATEGQLAALEKWHISPNRAVTRGEASDALLAVSALASWRKALRGVS